LLASLPDEGSRAALSQYPARVAHPDSKPAYSSLAVDGTATSGWDPARQLSSRGIRGMSSPRRANILDRSECPSGSRCWTSAPTMCSVDGETGLG
jgi:hypothetical protein